MSYLRDVLLLVGVGMMLYGIYLWSLPMGLFSTGLLLAVSAAAWSWTRSK